MSNYTGRTVSHLIEATDDMGDKVIVNTYQIRAIKNCGGYAKIYFAAESLPLYTLVPYKGIRKVLGFEEK